MAKKLFSTLNSIRRTPYQAIVAVMIMSLAFFAITSFAILTLGSVKVMQFFESAPQVIAFFKKGIDLPQEEISKIKSRLEQTGQLASFKYVSIHEAEAIYREKNKDDPLLLELVNYKILPPSIEISAKSIDYLPELKNLLEKEEGVEDIAFYEDVVQSLSSWIKNIRVFGLVVTAYLLTQSVLIIITITGMKILSRKEEIEILRLIGASKWFICWPFIQEGAIYGFFGAIVGWGTLYVALLYATPILISWFQDLNLLPVPISVMLIVLGANMLMGLIVGGVGGLISSYRFLRK